MRAASFSFDAVRWSLPAPSHDSRCCWLGGVRIKPFFAGRSVSLAWLVAVVVPWRRAFAAGIRADQAAVVAANRLGPNKIVHVLAALFAVQIDAVDDVDPVEDGACAAIRARSGLFGCRLAFPAHWIAYPASSRHVRSPIDET